jgi:glutamine cyclotransferase
MRFVCLFLLASSFWAAPPEYHVKVVRTYPHDRAAFSQGFEYHDGKLYEGTGLEGRSSVRIEDLESGKIDRRIDIASSFFGEGITVLGGRIVELTWVSHVGFIYEAADLHRTGEFRYEGEGWGLANDGRQIFFSDGTSTIRVLDPDSLQEVRRITVHEGGKQIVMLNELEYIRGEIWANVWQTDRIVRFSPIDGKVLGWVDASGLLTDADSKGQPVDVLNGIAYDAVKDRIFLTGKLWPKIFEIKVY